MTTAYIYPDGSVFEEPVPYCSDDYVIVKKGHLTATEIKVLIDKLFTARQAYGVYIAVLDLLENQNES